MIVPQAWLGSLRRRLPHRDSMEPEVAMIGENTSIWFPSGAKSVGGRYNLESAQAALELRSGERWVPVPGMPVSIPESQKGSWGGRIESRTGDVHEFRIYLLVAFPSDPSLRGQKARLRLHAEFSYPHRTFLRNEGTGKGGFEDRTGKADYEISFPFLTEEDERRYRLLARAQSALNRLVFFPCVILLILQLTVFSFLRTERVSSKPEA